MFGVGWSRKSIKRKISEGRPFTWIPGRHYVQVGKQALAAINVDAVFRELVK